MNGPGFVTTFLYYFGLNTFLGCFVASQAMGLAYNNPTVVESGLMLGLFAGVLGTALNRSATLDLPLPQTNREEVTFQQRLDKVLAELRFELSDIDEDGQQVYQKMLGWSVMSGRLYLERTGASLKIVGRISTIKRIKAKLQS